MNEKFIIVSLELLSAYVGAVECLSQSCKSERKSTKINRDNTPPWGTPVVTGFEGEILRTILTLWDLPVRKERRGASDLKTQTYTTKALSGQLHYQLPDIYLSDN